MLGIVRVGVVGGGCDAFDHDHDNGHGRARVRGMSRIAATMALGWVLLAGPARADAADAGVAPSAADGGAESADAGTAPKDTAWPGHADYRPIEPAVRAAGALAGDPERMLAAAEQALAGATGRSAALAHVARGLALYRAGRYREAAAAFGAVDRAGVAVADLVTFFEAESRFHAGDYAAAERILRDFERDFPRSTWRHRAAFRLADCLLARRFHGGAIATLRRLLRNYPEFPHRAAAHLAIAHAQVGRGHLEEAAAELRLVLRAWPGEPLTLTARRMLRGLEARGVEAVAPDVEALYEVAVDLRRRKYYDEALQNLQALLTDPRTDDALRRRVRWQIARTLYGMERFEEALTSFAALAADAPDPGHRRAATRWKAHCLERLGRLDDAAATLREAEGPGASSAGTLEDIAWLYLNGAAYRKAAEHFARLADVSGSWERETRWWRAWLAYRLGDYDVAIEAFKRLHATSRRRPDQYAYWLARALARKGEIEAAVDTYRGLIDSAPLSYYAYQSRERLRELGRGDAADRPLVAAPRPGEPDLGEDEGLEDARGSGCAEDDEDRTGCRPEEVAEADPEADPKEPGSGPTAARAAAVDGAADDVAPSEAAVATTAIEPSIAPGDPDGGEALHALARGWGALFPDLVVADELAALGERRLAAVHLRRVSDELAAFDEAPARRRDPGRWRFVPRPYLDHRSGIDRAEWGRELDDPPPPADPRRARALAAGLPGAFYRSLARAFLAVEDHHYAARRHRVLPGRLRGLPEDEAYRARWASRFPRAYREIVEANAAHYGLDPFLLWALMTVESTYNPYAVSRAGARGLLQVMPHTGGLIADRMAWRNFGPALLFEPEVAVEMGAWYFHQLLTKFNGQLPLAIAGYNAGPHRVAAWLERKGHLPMDEFIEEIPYTEARRYTKRVLRYLVLYRRIYERSSHLQVSQIIDPAFGDNINF